MKRLLSIALLCLAVGSPAEPLPVASLASPLDDSGASARAVGMGSAFVAMADDSTAMFFNPAGLAWLKRPEIALHHNTWLAGSTQEVLAMGWPLGNLGVLGAEASYLDFGSFPGYDALGASTGTYTAQRMGYGLGWGREWFEGGALGLTIKGQSESIATESSSAFAADFGASWRWPMGLRLGLSYNQLGTAMSGSALASSLKFGAAEVLEGDQFSLALAASTTWQPGGVGSVQLGVESCFLLSYFVRAGYQLNLNDSKISGLTGLSIGLGANYSHYRLDYAYQPFGDLGASQRLSVAYCFGEASPKAKAKPKPKVASKPVAKPTPIPELQAPLSLMDQGRQLETQGKFNEAMLVYRQAEQKDPKDGQAWKAMGKIYQRIGRKDYAAQCLKEAARLMPDDVEAGQLLKEAGN